MSHAGHVFGPVRSRRLGLSLGIDPMPFGVCSFDCVYCQLGRTHRQTTARMLPWEPVEVLTQLETRLNAGCHGLLDWISIVGAGEPTLYAGLGQLLRGIKQITDTPVAVITNGSLLYREDVQEELLAADAVLPSLDAGDEETFLAVNRPLQGYSYQRLVEGLEAFRSCFIGELWVEVMLVDGLNDSDDSLDWTERRLLEIGPDEVHLCLPTRPPAESWVKPPRADRVMAGFARFRGRSHGKIPRDVAGPADVWLSGDLGEVIPGIVARHPMTAQELARTLNVRNLADLRRWLTALRSSGELRCVRRFERDFWTVSLARYRDGSPCRELE